MTSPKVNGCICQTCADDGQECELVALDGRDECPDCDAGRHHERPEHPGEAGRQAMAWQGEGRTAYPRGRWFGDAGDVE